MIVHLLARRRLWIVGGLLLILAVGLYAAGPHVRAWYYRRAARSELERYHNPQALRHLQICQNIWPRDPEVLLLASRAARRDLPPRLKEAEEFLETYKQQIRGINDAGDLEQLLLSAECRVDQAAELCWRYVEQNRPDAPLILEALTRGYLREYRLAEARQSLDRWRQLQPDNPQALCLEGRYRLNYDREHSAAAAEESYRRAVELDGEHEEARLGLAVALLVQQKFAEAVEHLELLRRTQPQDSKILLALAEGRDGLGEIDEAVRLVDDVLSREPNSAPALAQRGWLAMKQLQYTDAENWLRQAVALDPVAHRARFSLYRCLEQNGKEEEARQMKLQHQQALDDVVRFNEIVSKDILQRPRDPALHCALGQILLRRGQPAEGLRWLQSALRIDPNYAPAKKTLAEYQRNEPRP